MTIDARTVVLAVLATSFANTVHASEAVRKSPDVVVSASRIDLPAQEIGVAATVIDRQDIEDSQIRIGSDILRRMPSVSVNRSGPAGTFTQVRIRGAEANQTHVRIDGIEVSDPASSNEFNFANLLAADIGRVTVLNGAQSALYGSDALAGVIDVRTRRGEGPFSIEAFVEGGWFATATGNLRLAAGNNYHDYALSVTGLRTDGINISQFGNEKDGYRNLSTSFVGAIRPRKSVEVDVAVRYTRFKIETDDDDFAFPATPTQGLVIDTDDETKGWFIYSRLGGTVGVIEDVLKQKFEIAFTDTKREGFAGGAREVLREGDRLKVGTQSHLSFQTPEALGAEHKFVAGYEREQASFDKSEFGVSLERAIVEHSIVGEYRIGLLDRIFLSGAVRRDWNQFFDDATTWRTTAAILVPETHSRIHASYGTGVTDPTFDDLFGFDPGSFVGNPSLQPEKSQSYDIGLEVSLAGDRAMVDFTYFHANLKNEIATTFDAATFLSSVSNLTSDSKRHGLEVSLTAHPIPGLSVTGSYTYTLSQDGTDTLEIRRPRHLASIHGSYRFMSDRALVDLSVDYNGDTEDSRFFVTRAPTRVTLDSYALLRIAGSYQITNGVEAFARVENALDENYQEVFSSEMPGIAGYAGIRAKLWPN